MLYLGIKEIWLVRRGLRKFETPTEEVHCIRVASFNLYFDKIDIFESAVISSQNRLRTGYSGLHRQPTRELL